MLDVICLMSMIIYITENAAVNLALRKPTTMSSLHVDDFAWYAVDGNTGSSIQNDHCTHTDVADKSPWWMVDLQETYLVNTVLITNRGDKYYERLHSFVIEIFENNPLRCADAISGVCFNNTGTVGQGETRTFKCKTPVKGRFVRIMKWKFNKDGDVLTLCEVQIFGNISSQCGYLYNMKRIDGTRLRSDQYELTTDLTPIECAVKCERKSWCVAFNFNVNTKECELLFHKVFNDTNANQPDWSYYGSNLCQENV